MSKRWLQCGVLAWPGGFAGWGPQPPSGEDEELAAWGQLQEGGPEAPAEGEKQGAPSEPSCRLHSQGTGSSFSRAWPCSPGEASGSQSQSGRLGRGQGGGSDEGA